MIVGINRQNWRDLKLACRESHPCLVVRASAWGNGVVERLARKIRGETDKDWQRDEYIF
jgi:hypothetical protein